MLALSGRVWRGSELRDVANSALSTVVNIACILTLMFGTLLVMQLNLVKCAVETHALDCVYFGI